MLITSLRGLEERENRASNMEALVYMGGGSEEDRDEEIPAIMRRIQGSVFLKPHLGKKKKKKSGTSCQRSRFIKVRFNRVNSAQTKYKTTANTKQL